MPTYLLAYSVAVSLLIFFGIWAISHENNDPHPSEPGPTQKPVPIEISTPDKLEYKFYPCSSGQIRFRQIRFRVKAPNDAHIALTTSPHEGKPMYEVFIGGSGNNKSVIRKNGKKPDVSETDTPSILTNDNFRAFWIRWHHDRLTVNREGDRAPFLSYDYPEPFDIAYFGVRTGWGASGEWVIEAESDCLWCNSSDGSLPLGSVIGGQIFYEELYIGRAWHAGDLIPGTIWPSNSSFMCYVAWGGKEYVKNEYQVLCGCSPKWVATSDGDIPLNAIPAGETKIGDLLFVGRAYHKGVLIVGKVHSFHGMLYIPFNGSEHRHYDYEILVIE